MTKLQIFTGYSIALSDTAKLRVLALVVDPSRVSHAVYL